MRAGGRPALIWRAAALCARRGPRGSSPGCGGLAPTSGSSAGCRSPRAGARATTARPATVSPGGEQHATSRRERGEAARDTERAPAAHGAVSPRASATPRARRARAPRPAPRAAGARRVRARDGGRARRERMERAERAEADARDARAPPAVSGDGVPARSALGAGDERGDDGGWLSDHASRQRVRGATAGRRATRVRAGECFLRRTPERAQARRADRRSVGAREARRVGRGEAHAVRAEHKLQTAVKRATACRSAMGTSPRVSTSSANTRRERVGSTAPAQSDRDERARRRRGRRRRRVAVARSPARAGRADEEPAERNGRVRGRVVPRGEARARPRRRARADWRAGWRRTFAATKPLTFAAEPPPCA